MALSQILFVSCILAFLILSIQAIALPAHNIMEPQQPNSNVTIYGYHFHMYFLPEDDFARHSIQIIHDEAKKRWGDKVYREGAIRIFEKPVGPHPLPMCQIELGADDAETNFKLLREVLPWVQMNVDTAEHPVLFHPLTTPFSDAEEVKDHTVRALWLGQKLQINLRKL